MNSNKHTLRYHSGLVMSDTGLLNRYSPGSLVRHKFLPDMGFGLILDIKPAPWDEASLACSVSWPFPDQNGLLSHSLSRYLDATDESESKQAWDIAVNWDRDKEGVLWVDVSDLELYNADKK